MTRTISACVALVTALTAGSAFAHHPPSLLGTVRFAQPVMADGNMLPAGTYEIRLTGEHLTPMPGQSEDSAQRVEFVANGMVVAREVATVMTGAAVAVGTSGATSGAASRGTTRARVETLKGGDFLRVSVNRDGSRYLIHLPVRQ